MIRVKNLTKSFSSESGTKRAVDDVSFDVEPGDILAFLGPNGAGKSTTMKMMTGFLPPTSGEVHYGTLSVTREPLDCQKHIGYVPENAPLYGDMRVEEFLRFCGQVRGLTEEKLQQRLEAVLAQCKLSEVRRERIDNLSKGYRRRVSIAQALIHDPQFLILDEPTDGLDPNQKHDVRGLLRELSQENKSIIISTHILEEVDAICNKVVLVAQGKVIFQGSVAEFHAQGPGRPITEVFRQLTASVKEVAHA